jgi:hypothetical protein
VAQVAPIEAMTSSLAPRLITLTVTILMAASACHSPGPRPSGVEGMLQRTEVAKGGSSGGVGTLRYPAAGKLEIYRYKAVGGTYGVSVATITVPLSGRFQAELDPGDYRILAELIGDRWTAIEVRGESEPFTVREGEFTSVTVTVVPYIP